MEEPKPTQLDLIPPTEKPQEEGKKSKKSTKFSISNILGDRRKLSVFFSRIIPITDFFVNIPVSGMVPCPFHDDNSPSAKFFLNDPDGIVRLHCFTEGHQFTSYDYVTKVLRTDPITFLTSKFSEGEMEGFISKVDFSVNKRPVLVDFRAAEEVKDNIHSLFNCVYVTSRPTPYTKPYIRGDRKR